MKAKYVSLNRVYRDCYFVLLLGLSVHLLSSILLADARTSVSRNEEDGELVVDKNFRLGRVGRGSGSIKEAPHWLQQDAPALYFPLSHHILQGFEDRGRRLLGEVSWGLHGSSKVSPSSFYTTVALGSQKQLFNVLIDSYSSLFWVQCDCEQCADSHPSSPTNPVALHKPFDSISSSSVSKPLCNSTLCDIYSSYNSSFFGCNVANVTNPNENCQFVSDTESSGNIIEDQIFLSLTNGSTSTPGISFGCGSFQSSNTLGVLPVYDGQLGLGRYNYSFIKQLSANGVSANSFSLCLDGGGILSHLLIGRTTLPTGAVYTPLIGESTSYWATSLTQISLNGTAIDVGQEVAFDTSQKLTLLPANLFVEISSQLDIDATPDINILYCSVVPQEITYENLNLLFPKLVLQFPSSENASIPVNMEVPPSNYFTAEFNATANSTTICLTAVSSENSSLPILGSSWLQNIDILFDETNSRIGWIPTNCTSGESLIALGPAQAPSYSFPSSTAPPENVSLAPSISPSPASSPSPTSADTNPVLALGTLPPPPPPPSPKSNGVSRHVKPTYLATLIIFSFALTFHYLTI